LKDSAGGAYHSRAIPATLVVNIANIPDEKVIGVSG
jgi:hypothetical protein